LTAFAAIFVVLNSVQHNFCTLYRTFLCWWMYTTEHSQ